MHGAVQQSNTFAVGSMLSNLLRVSSHIILPQTTFICWIARSSCYIIDFEYHILTDWLLLQGLGGCFLFLVSVGREPILFQTQRTSRWGTCTLRLQLYVQNTLFGGVLPMVQDRARKSYAILRSCINMLLLYFGYLYFKLYSHADLWDQDLHSNHDVDVSESSSL